MVKVGEKGVIIIKEERVIEDEIKITADMRFGHGYFSPYFVTDAKPQWVEFKKPFTLLLEKKVSLLQDVLLSLEIVAQTCHPFFIIAEGR